MAREVTHTLYLKGVISYAEINTGYREFWCNNLTAEGLEATHETNVKCLSSNFKTNWEVFAI